LLLRSLLLLMPQPSLRGQPGLSTVQRHDYRDFLKKKRESFWKERVASESSSPRQLWWLVNMLLGRGRIPSSSALSAVELHWFFNEKVAGVHANTEGAALPSFTAAPADCVLRHFRPVTANDVIAAVQALPDKQCASDVMPTRVLKEHVDLLAPFLVTLFNRSLELGIVPSLFKAAYITPLLKKPNLDLADLKS
jgi:hypothetical protein